MESTPAPTANPAYVQKAGLFPLGTAWLDKANRYWNARIKNPPFQWALIRFLFPTSLVGNVR